ncbi:MAG: tetratricopeptide repeat protein [Nitrospirae bacterium]|nr:tetratricopeptide repeat protein [Nitrospirota bacterium]
MKAQIKFFKNFLLLILFILAPATWMPKGAAAATPLDRQIEHLEARVAKVPQKIEWRNALARLYIQKGRETVDALYFNRAEILLKKTMAEDPKNGEAMGLQAWISLFKHDFTAAAKSAGMAVHEQPRESFYYGLLSDAYLELGDYKKAADFAQKMVNLRPDQGSYSRSAHLRFLYGDAEGAITLWKTAIRAGAPYAENTAWCEVELGDLYFNTGKIKESESAYQAALKIFPGYHRGFAGMGKIRESQGKMDDAEAFYQKAVEVVPYPAYIAALGDIETRMGKIQRAKEQFALIEHIARLDTLNQVLYNRDLALYYAEHQIDPQKAVQIAEKELDARRDIYTYDILSWVYYQNKDYTKADHAVKRALKLGTPDARILFHAGMIFLAEGKRKESKSCLEKALKLNPYFHPVYARLAEETLKSPG